MVSIEFSDKQYLLHNPTKEEKTDMTAPSARV